MSQKKSLQIESIGAAPNLLTVRLLRKIVLYLRSPLIFSGLRIIYTFFLRFSPVFYNFYRHLQLFSG